MVKSSLATEVYDFGTKNSNPRNQKVCRITIHHMAGNIGAKECAKMHYNGSSSSANYYIGTDGVICAGVSEDRRAWTSGNRPNDYSAITIEVANNANGTYTLTMPEVDGMLLLIAGYNSDGRLVDVRMEEAAAEVEIQMDAAEIKVFFCDGTTYAPVLPCLQAK